MFPRPPPLVKVRKFFGWKPSVYGNIDQTFYAMLMNCRPAKKDIWSLNETKEEIVGPEHYSYFVINTAVGVGAKGRDNIERVHIRFRLVPMKERLHYPEVVSIYPISMSELVGKTYYSEQNRKEAEIGGGAKAAGPFYGVFGWMGAKGRLSRSQSKDTQYTVPYHIITANASGVGNRAIWEFYRVRGMASIGQYDLKIFFRIPTEDVQSWPKRAVIRDSYCIDWNVEVNGERLVDHEIDFKGNWNMKVNGREMMDRKGKIEYERNPNSQKNSERKYVEYWNIPIHHNPSQKQGEEEKRIYDMMVEEDSKAEPQKLLRPLYLVNPKP